MWTPALSNRRSASPLNLAHDRGWLSPSHANSPSDCAPSALARWLRNTVPVADITLGNTPNEPARAARIGLLIDAQSSNGQGRFFTISKWCGRHSTLSEIAPRLQPGSWQRTSERSAPRTS